MRPCLSKGKKRQQDVVSVGSGPEKSLALQCWGPKRLNQDGDFEVELKDLGNPSLGGGSKHKGV